MGGGRMKALSASKLGFGILAFAGVVAIGIGLNDTAMASAQEQKPMLAETPPMGWNSWDGYGTTINEEQFKANAKWFAEHLKSYGWQYVTIDMEWFVTNPIPEGNSKTSLYALDANGRYVPDEKRF